MSISPFFMEVDRLIKTLPDPVIFLATDSPEAQRMMQERYDKVISTEKWFPTPGNEMHQNPECPDRLTSAIEALIDMYLLSQCNYLVFPSSSTFSYISSLYTNMPRGHIVDVERSDPVIRIIKLTRSWRLT